MHIHTYTYTCKYICICVYIYIHIYHTPTPTHTHTRGARALNLKAAEKVTNLRRRGLLEWHPCVSIFPNKNARAFAETRVNEFSLYEYIYIYIYMYMSAILWSHATAPLSPADDGSLLQKSP